MWPKVREWLARPRVLAVVVAVLLGGAAILYALPLRMLDPTDVGWMNRDDTLSHWLGWEQFRHAPLAQLPLGRNAFFGLEKSSTIVFSDSIPLMALLLHPIEGLLPTPFQYLGLWSALCFFLQGYFGFRLARLALRPAAAAAATGLFLMSAPMLNRIHVHTSLLSHWLVIAGVYWYFAHDTWRWRRWALLLVLACLVHGYLLGMVGVLWLAHLGKLAAAGELRGGWRVVAGAAARAAAVVAGLALVMAITGYFGLPPPNHGLYGQLRYDLLNPFCSYGIWSMATLPLPCSARNEDWDGQGFLGLGTIALLVIAVAALALALARRRRLDWSARLPRWPLVVACLFLVWFAATNRVVAGGHELVHYWLPARWLRLAENFRGSGRMAWPLLYAEMFLVLAVFARAVPARLHFWILLPLALYQAYDYRAGIRIINADLPYQHRIHALASPAWDQLAAYDRFIALPSEEGMPGWPDLEWQAARRGLACNFGYFVRVDHRRDLLGRRRLLEPLRRGAFDPRAVYLVLEPGLWEWLHVIKGADDVMLTADGYRLLFPGGRRLGLIDDPFTPAPALPAGQWRTLGERGDGDGAVTYGWTWEGLGARTQLDVAGLSIAQPDGERGQPRRVALHFSWVRVIPRRPVRQYRVLSHGRLLAEGTFTSDPAGEVIEVVVPAELTAARELELELQLPGSGGLLSGGRFLNADLWHYWISARPGDAPPPPPSPPAVPPRGAPQ